MQLGGAHAPFLQCAGLEIFDQHVGFGDQPAGQLLSLGLAEIDRDRLLVPCHDRPPQRLALVLQPAPVADRIASARGFDLDDLGAEVGAAAADEWSCQQLPHLHDPKALQRPERYIP